MNGTQTLNKLRIPLFYHSGQNKVFFESRAKKKVIAKGRRWGLTNAYANRAIEYLADSVSPGLWVDTVNGNIDRYVERYFYPVLRHIPTKYWTWRQQKKELELFGKKLDMRSADRPELIEGFAYKFIMLNEAGIILRNKYLYNNTILPMTLDYNPDLYIGGTPKGKGLFFELSIKAQTKEWIDKGWQFFRFTSFQNPYLPKEKIDELVNEIPASIQRQEIYAEFLEDSSTVFRNLEKCAVSRIAEPVRGEYYVVGFDIARLQDFTVINVLNSKGEQVYHERFKDLDWIIQKQKIRNVCLKYNNAQCWMDSTGVGDPIYEDLLREDLNVIGYKFTNETKKQLIHALMMSLEQQKIKILTKEAAPEQYNEMVIFEYEMTPSGLIRYQAPEGYHDDCVMSLALANWGFVNGAFGTADVIVIGETQADRDWEQEMIAARQASLETEQKEPETLNGMSRREIAQKYVKLIREYDGDMNRVAREMGLASQDLRVWVNKNLGYINSAGMGGEDEEFIEI